VNAKIRKQIERRKRRIARRLDKNDNRGCGRPIMTALNIRYEIADRTRATSHGGIGAIHLLTKKLGLDQAIDQNLGLLKIHLPYHDSDHVLNIAYNLLAGGTCLEHLELLRSDEAYLDALGARRIPDPTTAGDFCRRFDESALFRLQAIFNATRRKVWRQQPKAFFEEAILDADGTMAETSGECKQGMDINYKGQWGYHPLVLSLANTGEPLFVVNRSGNRPSHEQAAFYFDRAIALCRRAGFQLLSNWAYMVMGSLAWSLKAWAALVLPEDGRWPEKHREEKRKLLRMDFTTFRQAMMNVPAQILSTGRRIVCRLLAWNPWQHVFFRLLDHLRQPLRC